MSALSACGSDAESAAAREASIDFAAVDGCLATVEAMNGRACARERLTCVVALACDALIQHARCRCEQGTFRCEDSVSRIDVGGRPRCQVLQGASREECPPSEAMAEGRACDRNGRICFYEGASCPERPVPHYNDCTCSPHPDGELAYRCTAPKCMVL